jgi:hypothetical protein
MPALMKSASAECSALKYVTANDFWVDRRRFPDFFILGPQRTGTTWLYENLRFHPQIMMPTIKETHFFSSLTDPYSKFHHSTELSWYLSYFSEARGDKLKKIFRCLLELGERYNPIVKGEASASYAALHEDVIQDIVHLNPGLKLIMIVRDPVMRAWSHARKDLMWEMQRSIDDISEKEFEEFFTDKYVFRCSLFTENIERWTQVFGPKALFIGWFSDIQNRPVRLLSEITAFLGVSGQDSYVPFKHRQVINSMPDYPIPPRVLRLLKDMHANERSRLMKRFGRYN